MKWLNVLSGFNIVYLSFLWFLPTIYQTILYGCQLPLITIIYIILFWKQINNVKYQTPYILLILVDIVMSFILVSVMLFSYIYLVQ
jgi:hypothetical protein